MQKKIAADEKELQVWKMNFTWTIFIGAVAFRDKCKHQPVHSTAFCGLASTRLAFHLFLFALDFSLPLADAFNRFHARLIWNVITLLHYLQENFFQRFLPHDFHACMQFTPATFIHRRNFLPRCKFIAFFSPPSSRKEKHEKNVVSKNITCTCKARKFN